jgi:hypothetical protein
LVTVRRHSEIFIGKVPRGSRTGISSGPLLRARIQTKSYLSKCPHKIMTDHTAAERAPDSTINKIEQRKARVGIIGLGYVGLPLALLFTEQKFAVTLEGRHGLRPQNCEVVHGSRASAESAASTLLDCRNPRAGC